MVHVDNENESQALLKASAAAAATTTVPQQPRPTHERLPSLATLILSQQAAVIISNDKATARDHLANERTYLAWMRTGLALLGAALGILKLEAISSVTGYMVAILGLLVLVISTRRYFKVMQLLEHGLFEPNVKGITFVVVFIAITIIVAATMQVIGPPH